MRLCCYLREARQHFTWCCIFQPQCLSNLRKCALDRNIFRRLFLDFDCTRILDGCDGLVRTRFLN